MHVYVFWRMAVTPVITNHLSRRWLCVIAGLLWASYPMARIIQAWHWSAIERPFEFLGALWIGTLFLLFCATLVTDVITLGGFVFTRVAPQMRAGMLGLAGVLAALAIVQGLRPPVIRDYEVSLPGLPKERDGLVLAEVSDIHLGTLIGARWLERLVTDVNTLRPDIIIMAGDIVDGNVERVQPFVPLLKKLQAPLGVWAVTGNHEFYAGLARSLAVFESAGFSVLRDRWAEVAPGLVLAGVDDLTARREFGEDGDPVAQALSGRPKGATIFVSHSPLQADVAVRHGAGLMLCGHTHNGQIWPFKYLVQLRYRLIGGRYQVGSMPVIISRGAGTWGPRMRLWWPSEIVRIKLRAA